MKKFVTLSAASLVALTSSAEFLSPEMAWQRATADGPIKASAISSAAPECIMKIHSEGETEPSLYVFRPSGNGYIVVSADDCAAPVLGYGEKGSFSEENMPENLRWWLESYAAEITYARKNSAKSYIAEARPQRDRISPLLSTTWDQSAPYNSLCPKVGSTATVTGCAATAMAQVMKYFNWPEKGVSSISYSWNGQTLSMDFASTTFDWNNMLDSYGNSDSATSKTAVARLMKACGYSIQMNYGTGESSAQSEKIGQALSTYFNYDRSLWNACRNVYTNSDWELLIYTNLATCGPVLYSGSNSSSGHAFVCDGYDADGYFHINWGWSGMSDGYYLLSALNPGSQGIGGSTSGYNSGQSAILGIRKPQSSASPLSAPNIVAWGTPSVAVNGKAVYLFGPFYNYSTYTLNGHFALRCVNESTGQEIVTEYDNDQYEPGVGISYSGVSVANFPYGTWKFYPIFVTAAGEKVSISFPPYLENYARVQVGQTVTAEIPSKGNITATAVDFKSPFYLNRKFSVSATIQNTASVDYTREIIPILLRSQNIKDIAAFGDELSMELPAMASTSLEYVGSWSKRPSSQPAPTAGNYYFVFAVSDGYSLSGNTMEPAYKVISSFFPVTLKNASTPQISATISVAGNSNAVMPSELTYNLTVSCTSGYFSDNIRVGVFPGSGGNSIAMSESDCLFLESGQSKTVQVKCPFVGAPATQYLGAAFYNGNQITETIMFTTAANVALESVESDGWNFLVSGDILELSAPASISAVSVFSTIGAEVLSPAASGSSRMEIDLSSLPSGIYIVSVKADNMIRTHKFVKK